MNKPLPVSPALPTDRARHLPLNPRHTPARVMAMARVARMQREARAVEGISQAELGDAVDLDASKVSRSERGDEPFALNAVHLVLGARDDKARPFVLRFVRELVGEIDPAADVHGDAHAVRLASVLTECTDAPRALAAAMADGQFTLDELRAIEREVDEAATALAELRGWVGREIERRVERA